MEIKTNIGITGYMKAYLTDKAGVKKKVYEGSNTISPTFHLALAKALGQGYDISMLPLFTDDLEPTDGRAGIMAMYYSTSDVVYGFRSFITTMNETADNVLVFTGVYTNNTGTTLRIKVPQLGKNVITITGGPFAAKSFYDFIIAANNSFTPKDVPAGEALTIVWTITITVH